MSSQQTVSRFFSYQKLRPAQIRDFIMGLFGNSLESQIKRLKRKHEKHQRWCDKQDRKLAREKERVNRTYDCSTFEHRREWNRIIDRFSVSDEERNKYVSQMNDLIFSASPRCNVCGEHSYSWHENYNYCTDVKNSIYKKYSIVCEDCVEDNKGYINYYLDSLAD
ncbi:MAG: hypothetical protein LBF62_14185 [Tannerellaceae bacterium]|jgi:hypothetical protein|nr:hypothetical protein [Tannerellaceae bacterium]